MNNWTFILIKQGVALMGGNTTGPSRATPGELRCVVECYRRMARKTILAPYTMCRRASNKKLTCHRDSIRHSISVVNCCTTVWKISLEEVCNRWMILKVTQGHQNCRYFCLFLLVACSNNVYRYLIYYHIYSVYDCQ